MHIKALSDYNRVSNLRTAGGDPTGVADSTAAFESALASGGTLEIPPGTYLLNDADIPANMGDVTLKPLGDVIIKYADSGSYAIRFLATGNVSSPIAATTVADEDSYPSANIQRTTRITAGSALFAGWVAGDIGHVMSDDLDDGGFIKGEMFEVLAVDASSNYIITTEKLFYTYDAGANTTAVRRVTSRPKLTILPGITMRPSVDSSGSPAARPVGLRVWGAINADITMQFDDCYSMCVDTRANFRSKFRVTARDLYTNYSAAAYGYIAQDKGPSAQCEYRLNGERTGHMIAGNGDQTTYSEAAWYFAGCPKDPVVWECFAKSPRNTPYDWHWAIRPKCHVLIVDGAATDASGGSTSPYAMSVAGYDPWIGRAVITNTRYAVSLRGEMGDVASTVTIDDLTFISTGHPSSSLSTVGLTYTSGAIRPVIHIRKGTFRLPGKPAFHNAGSAHTGPGVRIIVDEAYFDHCTYIAYYSGTNDWEIEIGRYVYDNRNNTSTNIALVRYDAAITDKVRLLDGVIIPGATYPTGLVHIPTGAYATDTAIGTVRSSGRGLRTKTATSNASATAAITSLWCTAGETAIWRVTQTDASTVSADTSLYFAKGDRIEYTDPDSGDHMGLVCTTAGAGGTATFKEFGVVEA